MQEMEQERVVRENEEKEKAEKAQKMKETFDDPNGQWEKDKAAMQNMALNDKKSGGKASSQEEKSTPAPAHQADGMAVELQGPRAVVNQR